MVGKVILHDENGEAIELDELRITERVGNLIDAILDCETLFTIKARYNKLMKSVARISGDEENKILTLELKRNISEIKESIIYHELLHIHNRILDIERPLTFFFSNSFVSTIVSDLSAMYAHKIIHEQMKKAGLIDEKKLWEESINNTTIDCEKLIDGKSSMRPIDIIVFCNLLNTCKSKYKFFRQEIASKLPNTFKIANNIMKDSRSYNEEVLSERILGLENKINILRNEMKTYNIDKETEFRFDFNIIPLLSERMINSEAGKYLRIESDTKANRIRVFTSRSIYSIHFFRYTKSIEDQIIYDLNDLSLKEFFAKYNISFEKYKG